MSKMKQFTVLISAVVLLVLASCGRSSTDDLQEFVWILLEALQANEIDILAGDLSVNSHDVYAYADRVKLLSSGLDLQLSEDLSDEDLENAARDVVRVFRNSYEDLLNGEPALYSARVDPRLDSTSLIIWVKKGDKYHGILVHSIILTNDGYKVIDWLGPIAYGSKSFESLRKKTAVLESDDIEGCVYPRSGIEFKYRFVQ